MMYKNKEHTQKNVCIYLTIYYEQNMKQGPFLNGVQLVWIQISFLKTGCLTKAKESSLTVLELWRMWNDFFVAITLKSTWSNSTC